MQPNTFQIKKNKRNFDNDSCWETYCPCCPQCTCDCNCDCSCGCNCSKKRIIIPPFIISGIGFILIIVQMLTKISDMDSYKEFKLSEKEILKINNNLSDADLTDIYYIETLEDDYILALFVISFVIVLIYLILLLCFLYENTCCANYNPKCKLPYYSVLMFINNFCILANSMLSFIFSSYREDSINQFREINFFGDEYGSRNDLNISLNFICAFGYFACFILHLFLYYYLYKEDGICAGCCSEFLGCMHSIKECCICFFCCCWCCCDKPKKNISRKNSRKAKTQKTVTIIQENNIITSPFSSNNRVRNSFIVNVQENSQMRSLMVNNNNVKPLIDDSFKNVIYDYNYTQYKMCNLCKCLFRKGEKITVLNCGHIFHTDCSYNWFVNNKVCPEDGTIMIN